MSRLDLHAWMLRDVDYDADGQVSAREMARAQALFSEIDTNGDGIADVAERNNLGTRPFLWAQANAPTHPAQSLKQAYAQTVTAAYRTGLQKQKTGVPDLQRFIRAGDIAQLNSEEFDHIASAILGGDPSLRYVRTLPWSRGSGWARLQEELATRGVDPMSLTGGADVEAVRIFLERYPSEVLDYRLDDFLKKHEGLRQDAALIQSLVRRPDFFGLFDAKAVQANLEAVQNLERFNSFMPGFPGRMSDKVMSQLMLNRFNLEFEPKVQRTQKTAVVLYPSTDHNNAFEYNSLGDLIQNGYHVLYYEMGSDRDIPKFLAEAAHDGKSPVDLLIIGGHGTWSSMHVAPGLFGAGFTDQSMLDNSDLPRLRMNGVARYVKQGADIVLESCLSGYFGPMVNKFGWSLPLNQVTGIWEAWERKATVWGVATSTNNKLKFDEEGNFLTPGYIASDETVRLPAQSEKTP